MGSLFKINPKTANDKKKNNNKGVSMIRAEIGQKNRQIINETYNFRCFLIL
jgi:hypothetical protein